MAASSMVMSALTFVGLSYCVGATGDIPANAVNLTIYHVNQANYTGISNMNTADAAGDAVFDMRTLAEYQQCHNKSYKTYPSECTNPEQFATNNVITKLVIAVDPHYSKYGECNVCINSTVPFTRPEQHCVDGDYACNCENEFGISGPCPPQVGATSVKQEMEFWPRFMLPEGGPPAYWIINYVERVGGNWYSTYPAGDCDNPGRKSCQWKIVDKVKRVNATCQASNLRSKVESEGKQCFQTCSQPLQEHDDCYIGCYYETLLGPKAGSVYPLPSNAGGMQGDDIVKLWTDSFDECPDL